MLCVVLGKKLSMISLLVDVNRRIKQELKSRGVGYLGEIIHDWIIVKQFKFLESDFIGC